MKHLRTCLLAAVMATSSSAFAQNEASPSDEALVGSVYARLSAGYTFVDGLVEELSYNPDIAFAVAPPTRRRSELANGIRMGAAIGFDYPASTRTELEYRYSAPEIDRVLLSGGAVTSDSNPDAELTTHLLMSNLYYDFENRSAVTPFVGAGIGGVAVTNAAGEKDAAFAWQARAGLSANLSDALNFDVEYIWVRSGDLEFGPKEFGDASVAGVNSTGANYQSSSIMASIRKTF